jgi:anthranilate phosphoribosyltransferase
LDGYDEISLTCDFKTFSAEGEKINSVESMGFEKLNEDQITGGHTVSDSADIFMKCLTMMLPLQNNVVLSNAAMAIKTIHPKKALQIAFTRPRNRCKQKSIGQF